MYFYGFLSNIAAYMRVTNHVCQIKTKQDFKF